MMDVEKRKITHTDAEKIQVQFYEVLNQTLSFKLTMKQFEILVHKSVIDQKIFESWLEIDNQKT